MTQRTVLHVGPGKSTLAQLPEGFQDGTWREIRYDIDPDLEPDIVGSITDMSAIESESVDAVFSSHNIEHVFAHEVATVFSEWHRVLKPSGFLSLVCPDLETVAKHIVRTGLTEPIYQSSMGPIRPIDILYGHSTAIAGGAHYMAHRTGFSMELLNEHAKRAGFASIMGRQRTIFVDLWLIATKSQAEEATVREMMEVYGGKREGEQAAEPAPAA